MKRKTKWMSAGAVLLAVGIAAFFIWDEMETRSAIAATLAWARMDEIPDELKIESLETRGSMFTREFILRISGDEDLIGKWMTSSPGIQDAARSQKGNDIIYTIEPGEGAESAEAIYSPEGPKVTVRVFWS